MAEQEKATTSTRSKSHSQRFHTPRALRRVPRASGSIAYPPGPSTRSQPEDCPGSRCVQAIQGRRTGTTVANRPTQPTDRSRAPDVHARRVTLPPLPALQALRDRVASESPLRRGVSPSDVGALATFLASDAAAAITGQTLYVDAGHSAVMA